MEKTKKFIAAVLAAATLTAGLTGCHSEEPEEKPDENAVPAEYVLSDFESWYSGFSTITIFNDFGKVSVNTDPTYVSRGKQSARLDPLGGKYGGSAPIVVFGTKSSKTGMNLADFGYADYICFDFYNPQEEGVVYAGIVSQIKSSVKVERTSEKEIRLHQGWNECRLNIESSLIDLVGDLEDVDGFYLRFEPAYSADIVETGDKATPRYYIDNIRIVNKPVRSESGLEILLPPGELADFEEQYQGYMFTNDNPGIVQAVKASDYNLTAPSGEHVLRATFRGLGKNSSVWQQMSISESLLRASELLDMPADVAKKAYLCCEVYNANEASIGLSFVFRTPDAYLYAVNMPNSPGKWTTFQFCLGDLLKLQSNYMSTLGPFLISYKTAFEGDYEFFFDNFRIEIR